LPKKAQSQAQMATQVRRAQELLAPGLEGTDFRGVRGLGVERPFPQNKRCLEDAVPGNPKNWLPRDRRSQDVVNPELFRPGS
jgi:hypothetical protein